MLPDNIQNYVKEKLSIVSDNDISETILGNGRSGAKVCRLKVKSRKMRLTGHYIIKICDISSSNVIKKDKIFL